MMYVERHGKRIAVDTINTSTPAKKKRKPFEPSFVKLPHFWIERLMRSKNPGTFKLAFHILKEDFKRQHVGGEIVLSTKATGLPREVRRRAVRELIQLGLIQTEQNGNQAIRVTSIIEREEEKKRIEPCGYAEATRPARGRDATGTRTRRDKSWGRPPVVSRSEAAGALRKLEKSWTYNR
jgi:hypothetical protein